MQFRLDWKATYFFMLRFLPLIVVGGLFVFAFSSGTSHTGANNRATMLIPPFSFRTTLWGGYALLVAIGWFWAQLFARSYKIELKDNGLFLTYGMINLNSETMLFAKIQDIVINRSLAERVMGLSTIIVQNAMGQPGVLPGLAVEDAEKLRDAILVHIKKA